MRSAAGMREYKAVGMLRGATDASPTVRTFLADGPDAEKILTAARALRERAGTLSGMAAGDEVTRQARDVLADVLAVFAGEPGPHWQAGAQRLAPPVPGPGACGHADAPPAHGPGPRVRAVE